MPKVTERAPSPRLLTALERLGPSDHLCMSYTTEQELLAATIAFIRLGLDRHEQCAYIANGPVHGAVLAGLRAAGLDVEAATADATLSVLTWADTYLQGGCGDSERMLAWVDERAGAALRAGFTAFRFVAEMSWCVETNLPVERLAAYEAEVTPRFARRPVSALCAYDRRRFSHDVIRQIIVTHPLVVVGEAVCRNPYFVPPQEYRAPDWPDREVDWLLASLDALQRAEDSRRESEARHRIVARRMLDVQESERRAIARELHDQLGQILTGIKISLQCLAPRAGAADVPRVDHLAESLALADEALALVRDVTSDLRPPMLDDVGLATALRTYVRRQARRGRIKARADVDVLETLRLPPAVELACFRLVQEATTNIVRHARASDVEVRATAAGGALEIVVRDDGPGFDVAAARQRAATGGSFGLVAMEERVALAGGQLTIESTPGRGTTIRARFPLPAGGASI